MADPLELESRLRVVLINEHLPEILAWKKVHQAVDPGLDHVDGRGLQRLEEAAGQPEGDHVLVPRLAPYSARETKQPRFGERPPVKRLKQRRRRLVVADVAGGGGG